MKKKLHINKQIETVLNNFIKKVNKENNTNYTEDCYFITIRKNRVIIYLLENLDNFKTNTLQQELQQIHKRYKFIIKTHTDYKTYKYKEYKTLCKKYKKTHTKEELENFKDFYREYVLDYL